MDGVVRKPFDLSVLDRVATRALLFVGVTLPRCDCKRDRPAPVVRQRCYPQIICLITAYLNGLSARSSKHGPQWASFRLGLEELAKHTETASFKTSDDCNDSEDRISKASFLKTFKWQFYVIDFILRIWYQYGTYFEGGL